MYIDIGLSAPKRFAIFGCQTRFFYNKKKKKVSAKLGPDDRLLFRTIIWLSNVVHQTSRPCTMKKILVFSEKQWKEIFIFSVVSQKTAEKNSAVHTCTIVPLESLIHANFQMAPPYWVSRDMLRMTSRGGLSLVIWSLFMTARCRGQGMVVIVDRKKQVQWTRTNGLSNLQAC